MTTLPLGLGAYKRAFAKGPEVKLVNRYAEKDPTNLREHVSLLTRPGTHLLGAFPAGQGNHVRGTYTKRGLFGGDLFVSAGKNFYRYDGTTRTKIIGELAGEDSPRVTWSKGAGYEYLFVADGTALYYYAGAGNAKAELSDSGGGSYLTDVVVIDGVYYGWGSNMSDPLDDGTAAHPFVCVAGSSPLAALVKMLTFTGTPGTDFSSTLGGPNVKVTASYDADNDTVTATAREEGADGNLITVTVDGSPATGYLSWSSPTLQGGGVHALHQIAVPDAVAVTAVTSLNGFVLVSVGNTQKFFFIRPGETHIDALDFFTKESNPDPIIDMATVGDVAIIAGAGSTEYWSATGDVNVVLAPVQGRTAARGIIAGTLVVVDDSTYIAVGDDGKVYAFTPAAQTISNHGIEERIRTQLRREAELV